MGPIGGNQCLRHPSEYSIRQLEERIKYHCRTYLAGPFELSNGDHRHFMLCLIEERARDEGYNQSLQATEKSTQTEMADTLGRREEKERTRKLCETYGQIC